MGAAQGGAAISEKLAAALALPNGARFYRCALQVNPFAYLSRHSKPTNFQTESDYNAAIIAACQDAGIEVIGVTDHYRVKDSVGLIEAARSAGIFAFSGFEAVTKDGVHFICLFDPDKDAVLERLIGECGIRDMKEDSPTGSLDSEEFLACAKSWGTACVAAHVTAEQGGLLRKLSGKTGEKVWKSELLLACAIPGSVNSAPDGIRQILDNKGGEYHRKRAVAVINACDVNGPDDFKKDGTSCFIKMSDISVEGLRQAFLDPFSRIRLNSDAAREPHAEFLAMTWEGGFLSGLAVHFNENLNVLIGGRGTGKSTMVESMRYVLGLDPLGEDARTAHQGVVRNVLRSGTKISLLVRSHRPSERQYVIERSVPNPPIVKDEFGAVLTLLPGDVMPGVEIFGQHEISELTKSPAKLTSLLERFADRDPSLGGRKAKVRLDLERSRSRIADVRRELKALDERLDALPGLEEMQKRFQAAGIEERLKEKSLLIREERAFRDVTERLEPIRALHAELVQTLPLDTAFVSAKALEALPNGMLLAEIQPILGILSKQLKTLGEEIAETIANADESVGAVRARWDEKRIAVEDSYERLLRELQKSKVDGTEFIRLRKQIEELRPMRERKEIFHRDLVSHESQRLRLLAEWEDIKASEYREVQRAAKKVCRELKDRVQVEVSMAGNREPLLDLLGQLGGNLKAAFDRLRAAQQFSLPEFVQCCREGKQALIERYGFPAGSAERIAQADEDLLMRIEQLDIPATTQIELNTAPERRTPVWQTLENLSTGQKATAVLLLLLLESGAPLVVDQPEDDLDNRFITDGVVPILRQEKRRRQFILSTHNANIPVLGDAELILGLAASGEGGAKIPVEHMGSIETYPVRELVEEILEGGKDAFEMRRSKYGF